MIKYRVITVVLGLAYWLVDSSVHWFLFGESLELIPNDPNEVWMRSFIVLMIIAIGIYADVKTKEILRKEQEKHRIFRATVYSTQHILNNLLNQLLYISSKLEDNDSVDPELIAQLNEILRKSSQQVVSLSEVEDISEEAIKQSVYPRE